MYLSYIGCSHLKIRLFLPKCYTYCYTYFYELGCLRKSIIVMKISIMPILRKDKIKKDKTAPIHIRVIHNRKSRFIGTGVTIPIDGWDVEKHQVQTNLPERKELQLQIDKKISELQRRMK